MVVLLDCGTPHNLISLDLVQQLQLLTSITSYFVEVGDGHKIKCQGVCSGVIGSRTEN